MATKLCRYSSPSRVPLGLGNSHLKGQNLWWLWHSCLLIWQEIFHFSTHTYHTYVPHGLYIYILVFTKLGLNSTYNQVSCFLFHMYKSEFFEFLIHLAKWLFSLHLPQQNLILDLTYLCWLWLTSRSGSLHFCIILHIYSSRKHLLSSSHTLSTVPGNSLGSWTG